MLATRRRVVRAVLGGALAGAYSSARAQSSAPKPASSSEGLTRYVADFIVKTGYADIPTDVIDAGKKSILDGLGLAFSGSVAETGERSRTYISSLGLTPGKA